jgi:hypothetical protein
MHPAGAKTGHSHTTSSHDSSSSKGIVLPVASLSLGSWLDALPTWEVEIKL